MWFGGKGEIGSGRIARSQQFLFPIASSAKFGECSEMGIRQGKSGVPDRGAFMPAVARPRAQLRLTSWTQLELNRLCAARQQEAGFMAFPRRAFPQIDIEPGSSGKMAKNFDSQRFAARPGTGIVDSLATAHPDRSPTNREES